MSLCKWDGIPMYQFYDHDPDNGRLWTKRCDTSVELVTEHGVSSSTGLAENMVVRGTVLMADDDLILAVEQDDGTTIRQLATHMRWKDWDRFVAEVNDLRHGQQRCQEGWRGNGE